MSKVNQYKEARNDRCAQNRDQLLIKLGQVNEEAGGVAWKLVQITVAKADGIAASDQFAEFSALPG